MSISRQPRPSASAQPRGATCVTIAAGDPLPACGAVITLDSPVAGLAYRVTVHAILRLEWQYDPRRPDDIIGLRVWVRGEKEVIATGGVAR